MALKTRLDTQDTDTAKVDIPLFATAKDAVKDIKVEQATIKVQVQSEEQKDERED